MSLTPTEREEHFFKAIVDAADGSTPEELEPTERREHWYKEIIDAIKAGGGGSGGLPTVTSTDNGKVLTVADGAWTAQANDVVLNATPTYQDGYWTIAVTSQLPSVSDLEAWFKDNRHIVLHFSNVWDARLYAAQKDVSTGYGTFYSFTGYGENFDGDKIRYLLKFSVISDVVSCTAYAYIDGKYIVTLTPTAADYSGTMDKTVAEINAAYEAGQEIVFELNAGTQTFEIPLAYRCVSNNSAESAYFTLYIIDTANNIIINAWTTWTDATINNTYSTKIYALTLAT